MKTLIKLLPYLRPYGSNLIGTALFNLLLAVFTVFTIPAFIPFFQILFNTVSTDAAPAPGILQSIKTFFEQLIANQGKEIALTYVCAFLLIVLFFKNLFRYLALY
ncbi:MAG: ABC transporter ATP-binding protein, partial [Saprospiraceae bacterium]